MGRRATLVTVTKRQRGVLERLVQAGTTGQGITLPTQPGLTERIEFEYIRHGTLCLMANWDVANGRVREATIGPTRTEQDFVAHIKTTIDTDPDAGWVFVVDQLNTHMSEGLHNLRERLVAFIEYFNRVLAKPFKWTYTGRPLQA